MVPPPVISSMASWIFSTIHFDDLPSYKHLLSIGDFPATEMIDPESISMTIPTIFPMIFPYDIPAFLVVGIPTNPSEK